MSVSVVLDSNSYISDYRMASPTFSAFFDFVGKTGSEIVLFKLVEDEVLANYQRDFNEKVLGRWDKKIKGILVSEELAPRPDLDRQLTALRDRLMQPAPKVRIVRVDDYPGVTVSEIVRRGVQRIPPANCKGEELRDVILWLAAVEYAKQKKVELAFITNDSGFWEQTADQPLPQIQKDIADANGAIKLYRRLEAFLAANVLPKQPVEEKWALQVFAAAKLGDLLVNRMVEQKFHGSVLSQNIAELKFESGFLYDIGADAYFSELVFSVKCELQLQSYVVRAHWPFRVETAAESGSVADIPPIVLHGEFAGKLAEPTTWSVTIPTFAQGSSVNLTSSALGEGRGTSFVGSLVSPRVAETVVENISVETKAKYSIRLLKQQVVERDLDNYEILHRTARYASANEQTK